MEASYYYDPCRLSTRQQCQLLNWILSSLQKQRKASSGWERWEEPYRRQLWDAGKKALNWGQEIEVQFWAWLHLAVVCRAASSMWAQDLEGSELLWPWIRRASKGQSKQRGIGRAEEEASKRQCRETILRNWHLISQSGSGCNVNSFSLRQD